jgi:hypothetical protein
MIAYIVSVEKKQGDHLGENIRGEVLEICRERRKHAMFI